MNRFKLYKLFLFYLYISLLGACAETPNGTIIVNEETVENYVDKTFENGKGGLKSYSPPSELNLVWDQPVASAEIPSLPPDQIRIYGPLNSAGYREVKINGQKISRGSSFQKSVYGMLGDAAPGGTAWFYADILPTTGQIVAARAYLYGFNNGVCDLRQPNNGSFGKITNSGFILTLDGYCHFPSQSGTQAEYALLVEGKGNLLTMGANASVEVRYLMDNSGKITTIPVNPAQNPQIYDYGKGVASISMNISRKSF